MMKPVAPGEPQTGKDAGSEVEHDEPAPAPTVEDDGRPAPQAGADDDGAAGADKSDQQPERSEPKKPPSDSVRDQIAARFNKQREEPEADAGDGDAAGDDALDEDAARARDDYNAAAAADAAGGDKTSGEKPQKFTLKVNGKERVKSLQELAVLADMTPEEVLERPEHAIRFAQRELATSENLEESRKIRRETSSRTDQRGSDSRSDRAPLHQEDDNNGTDDPDQQPGARKTTDVVAKANKLVEDIQLASPEEAGEKLLQFVKEAASEVVGQTVQQDREGQALRKESEDRLSAMRGVLAEHPEIAKSKVMVDAVTGQVLREYRADLRASMIAEGATEEEADQTLRAASNDQITQAHRMRRARGDQNVRAADKAFFEKAYETVRAEIGGSPQPNNKGLQEQRRERKEALSPQPRRASVPPATQRPAPKPQSRSSAVAELAAARGQKGSAAPRA